MSTKIRLIAMVMLLLSWSGITMANYDPTNPPEPYQYNKLTVAVSPTAAGTASGAGFYMAGTSITIRCSGNEGYTFSHWTLNGYEYGTSTSFTYIMGDSVAAFVAVYTKDPYDPTNPEEPYTTAYGRVYLESIPVGCCSFNRTSGEKLVAGTTITITAYPNQSYIFEGWYKGTELISEAVSFTYVVPEGKDTLTIHYYYDPVDPLEPDADTEGVDNPGLTTTLMHVEDAESTLKAYGCDGKIVIENAGGESVKVYDMMGKVVYDHKVCNSRVEMKVSTAGIYLLEVGNEKKKMLVK